VERSERLTRSSEQPNDLVASHASPQVPREALLRIPGS
jgi:hypothetical protein